MAKKVKIHLYGDETYEYTKVRIAEDKNKYYIYEKDTDNVLAAVEKDQVKQLVTMDVE
ncbi:MAG: hypothetical protein ACP5SH_16650 [Syntrophobacteraceae bacterium]